MKKIILNYYNPGYKIAMGKWNEVFYLPGDGGKAVELLPECYKGRLVFRLPGSSQRLSYKTIKAGLKNQTMTVCVPVSRMPF